LIVAKTVIAGIWEELVELCSTLTLFLLLSLGLLLPLWVLWGISRWTFGLISSIYLM